MQKDKKKTPPKNQPIHLLGLVSEVQNIIVSLSRAQQYKMLDKDIAESRIRSSVLRTWLMKKKSYIRPHCPHQTVILYQNCSIKIYELWLWSMYLYHPIVLTVPLMLLLNNFKKFRTLPKKKLEFWLRCKTCLLNLLRIHFSYLILFWFISIF